MNLHMLQQTINIPLSLMANELPIYDSNIDNFLGQNIFEDTQMLVYSEEDNLIQFNGYDFIQAKLNSLLSVLADLDYRDKISTVNVIMLMHELVEKDILDFNIGRTIENEILVFRKLDKFQYKNIFIDESNSYTLKYIDSDPTKSIFKVFSYTSQADFLTNSVEFFS